MSILSSPPHRVHIVSSGVCRAGQRVLSHRDHWFSGDTALDYFLSFYQKVQRSDKEHHVEALSDQLELGKYLLLLQEEEYVFSGQQTWKTRIFAKLMNIITTHTHQSIHRLACIFYAMRLSPHTRTHTAATHKVLVNIFTQCHFLSGSVLFQCLVFCWHSLLRLLIINISYKDNVTLWILWYIRPFVVQLSKKK